MNEMIERVKLALRGFEAGWLLETGSVNPSGNNYETAKARAAIEAMREPTKTMVEAGRLSGEWQSDSDGERMDGNADEVWPAMIDAALKD